MIFTKIQRKSMLTTFIAHMAAIGAAQDDKDLLNYQYSVQTRYGVLRIDKPEFFDGNRCLSLHTRFDDPGRAWHGFNPGKKCVPFSGDSFGPSASGKWNEYFAVEGGPDYFTRRLTERWERVKPCAPEQL